MAIVDSPSHPWQASRTVTLCIAAVLALCVGIYVSSAELLGSIALPIGSDDAVDATLRQGASMSRSEVAVAQVSAVRVAVVPPPPLTVQPLPSSQPLSLLLPLTLPPAAATSPLTAFAPPTDPLDRYDPLPPTGAPSEAAHVGAVWDTHISTALTGGKQLWNCKAACGSTREEWRQYAIKRAAIDPAVAVFIIDDTNWKGVQAFDASALPHLQYAPSSAGAWSAYIKRGVAGALPPTPAPTQYVIVPPLHRARVGFGVTAAGATYARAIHQLVPSPCGTQCEASLRAAETTCRALNPRWEFVRWRMNETSRLLAAWYPPIARRGQSRSALVRWAVLYRHGGVWAPTGTPCSLNYDTLFARAPEGGDAFFTPSATALVSVDLDRTVVARAPGNLLWKELLRRGAHGVATLASLTPNATVGSSTQLLPRSGTDESLGAAAVEPHVVAATQPLRVSSSCPHRARVQSDLDKMRMLLDGKHARSCGPVNASFVVVSMMATPAGKGGLLVPLSWEFLQRYCVAHPTTRAVQLSLRFDSFNVGRFASWFKVIVLRALLERHSRALWVDMDMTAASPALDLEAIVATGLNDGSNLAAQRDNIDMVCGAMVAVRKTLRTLQFLEYWWAIVWDRNATLTPENTLNKQYHDSVLDPFIRKAAGGGKEHPHFHRCNLEAFPWEQGCLNWVFDDYRDLFPLRETLHEWGMGYGVGAFGQGFGLGVLCRGQPCSGGQDIVHFPGGSEASKAAQLRSCLDAVKRGKRCKW